MAVLAKNVRNEDTSQAKRLALYCPARSQVRGGQNIFLGEKDFCFIIC